MNENTFRPTQAAVREINAKVLRELIAEKTEIVLDARDVPDLVRSHARACIAEVTNAALRVPKGAERTDGGQRVYQLLLLAATAAALSIEPGNSGAIITAAWFLGAADEASRSLVVRRQTGGIGGAKGAHGRSLLDAFLANPALLKNSNKELARDYNLSTRTVLRYRAAAVKSRGAT
jgi:hypothetical protein